MSKITIIIPCFNNEQNLLSTSKRLIENESNFPANTVFEYILVDDGSQDETYKEMKRFQETYPEKVKLVKLSRNFGASNANLAAYPYSTGDCIVNLPADLQDPPELVPKMFKHWQNGVKLVLANKIGREDKFFSKRLSSIFHTLTKKYVFKNAPEGGFNICLFDKQLKEDILSIKEKNTYLPSLFLWLGYEYVAIPYQREERKIGQSGWTFKKKLKAFIDSFVGFSYLPIRIISGLGLIMGMISLLYGVWLIIAKLNGKIDIEGWATLVVLILFLGSFLMISIGVLGEYIWRALDAARDRPNFIIDEVIDTKEDAA